MAEERAITVQNGLPTEILEKVVVGGDLSRLSSAERLQFYAKVCDSLGLNPLTRPFEYIHLQGKLTLYARRDCTDQLRKIHHVTVAITARERHDDVYVVTARATLPDGRSDEAIGAVSIAGLKGDALANALMKAETKAKRRVTLSIVGLGWLDETEVETIPEARPVVETPWVERLLQEINACATLEHLESLGNAIQQNTHQFTEEQLREVRRAWKERKALLKARAAQQQPAEQPAATAGEVAF